MPKWEYRAVPIFVGLANNKQDGGREGVWERDERLESCLSDMGKDGWELVSFLPEVLPPEVVAAPGVPSMYHAIFKRQAE